MRTKYRYKTTEYRGYSFMKQKAICNCDNCQEQVDYEDIKITYEHDCFTREEICPVCESPNIWLSCECKFCDEYFVLEDYDIDPERIVCPFCGNTGEIGEDEDDL